MSSLTYPYRSALPDAPGATPMDMAITGPVLGVETKTFGWMTIISGDDDLPLDDRFRQPLADCLAHVAEHLDGCGGTILLDHLQTFVSPLADPGDVVLPSVLIVTAMRYPALRHRYRNLFGIWQSPHSGHDYAQWLDRLTEQRLAVSDRFFPRIIRRG